MRRQLVGTIRALSEELERVLCFEDALQGPYQSGRVDRHRLHMSGFKEDIFCRRETKCTAGEVCVQILLDLSGSMSRRIQEVRQAAVILHEALLNLDIVHGIVGHTTRSGEVCLLDFVRPGHGRMDSSRLASVASHNNNIDGCAIRCMIPFLKAQPEEVKILFVINDGLPCESNTRGLGPVEDSALAVKEASKVATVVGVWVGDKEPANEFKTIYPDWVAVDDMRRLPQILGRGLTRVVGK
jgi:nitric oxide reductase activation protein